MPRGTALTFLTESRKTASPCSHPVVFAGKELVHLLAVTGDGAFYDGAQQLPAQKSADSYDVLVDMAPFALKTIEFRRSRSRNRNLPSRWTWLPALWKHRSILLVGKGGMLSRIFDKENQRSVLKDHQYGNVLEILRISPSTMMPGILIFSTSRKRDCQPVSRPSWWSRVR